MLTIDQLSYQYKNEDIEVLRDISFSLEAGQVASLVGANGSGKSTLLKNISFIVKGQGRITLDDVVITEKNRYKLVSYLPQNSACDAALTVFEIILLGKISQLGVHVSDENMRAVQMIINRMGLNHLANQYIHELSGGQQQLVFIAQTLIRDNPILLLDEPISALDINHQFELMELIRDVTKQLNRHTVVVLHHLDIAAKYTDLMVVLKNGRIYNQGKPKDILTQDMLKDVYNVESTILYEEDGTPHVIPLGAVRKE